MDKLLFYSVSFPIGKYCSVNCVVIVSCFVFYLKNINTSEISDPFFVFFLFEENKYVTFVGHMVGPQLTLFVCLFVCFI